MSRSKRRDSKHRVLRNGESIRADGKYQFKYYVGGKIKFVYSWRLEPTDPVPKGKRPGPFLREMEKQIGKDFDSMIDPSQKGMLVIELVAMHWEHRFNSMVNRYNAINKEQMPNITPHICRHTYCSNMAKAGMNPKTLQYLMGHSDITVTLDTYTHLGLEDAAEELKRLAEVEQARLEQEKPNRNRDDDDSRIVMVM